MTSVTGSTEIPGVALPEHAQPQVDERGPGGPPPAGRPSAKVEHEQQDWYRAVRSVRTRILASYVVLLALSASIAILAFRQALFSQLEDRVQDGLQQEVREFDRLVAVGNDPETGAPFTSVGALFDVYLAPQRPEPRGGARHLRRRRVLSRSASRSFRSTGCRPRTSPTGRAGRAASPARRRARSATSRPTSGGRTSARGGSGWRNSTGVLIVTILPAAELEDIDDLQTYGAGATVGILLLASAVAWFIAGRVLAPVRQLTETARSISESDLTHRIEIRGGGEAADMARSFNAMLDRLESVFQSQREFVQDASHELRDPLTICRGHLELLGDDPEERRATTALVLDELDRIGRIVDDLQLLAEAEHPDFLRREWIDLDVLTHELVAKATALAPRRWGLDRVASGSVFADRQRLTEAVMNLAHNAVQHTVAHDSVAIGSAARRERGAHLGARHGLRDRGRGPGEDLRALQARRRRAPPLPRRRARPRDREDRRRGARRPRRAREPARRGLAASPSSPGQLEQRSSWWPGS